jgi:hypothetical protein
MGFGAKAKQVWKETGFLQRPQSAKDAGAADFRPTSGIKRESSDAGLPSNSRETLPTVADLGFQLSSTWSQETTLSGSTRISVSRLRALITDSRLADTFRSTQSPADAHLDVALLRLPLVGDQLRCRVSRAACIRPLPNLTHAPSAWSTGSALLSVGLSFRTTVGASVLGYLLIAFVAVGAARIGSRYHIGFPVWARSAFGMRLSKLFVGLRGVSRHHTQVLRLLVSWHWCHSDETLLTRV